MKRLVFLAAISSLLWACGQPDTVAGSTVNAGACPQDAGPVAVIEPWIRAAESGRTTAAYFTLCNAQDRSDALIAVRTNAAAAVELHETARSADGVVSMTRKDAFELPPSELVALAPGGAHIMLIGVENALTPESVVALTLEFRNSPPVSIEAEVRGAGEAGHHAH